LDLFSFFFPPSALSMTIMAKTSLQNVNNKLEASQTFRGLAKARWFVVFFGATISSLSSSENELRLGMLSSSKAVIREKAKAKFHENIHFKREHHRM
jgi:cytochrome c biogenesis factor